MLVPLLVSSIAAGLLSITSYFPYKNSPQASRRCARCDGTQHQPPAQSRALSPALDTIATRASRSRRTILLRGCRPGPTHGHGVSQLRSHPLTGTLEPASLRMIATSSPRSKELPVSGPGIHTNEAWLASCTSRRPPPEYPIKAPTDLLTTFHPLGIAVTASHPYFVEEVDEGVEPRPEPPANLVLVANKPYADRPGVVDIFVHDLDKVGVQGPCDSALASSASRARR